MMRDGEATHLDPRFNADGIGLSGKSGERGDIEHSSRCEVTHRQRMRALDNANEVRFSRAGVRRQLQRGELDFDLFLDEMPESCTTVPLVKLLVWLPNIGRSKAHKILHLLPLDTSVAKLDIRMGELPTRAKYELSLLVHKHVDGCKYWERVS